MASHALRQNCLSCLGGSKRCLDLKSRLLRTQSGLSALHAHLPSQTSNRGMPRHPAAQDSPPPAFSVRISCTGPVSLVAHHSPLDLDSHTTLCLKSFLQASSQTHFCHARHFIQVLLPTLLQAHLARTSVLAIKLLQLVIGEDWKSFTQQCSGF